MKLIQSRDNPYYKELVKLSRSSRHRSKVGQTLLDGTHLLDAYLDAGMLPQQVLVNSVALGNAEVIALLERATNIAVTQLDDKLFDQLSELKSPTGILALIDITQQDMKMEQIRFALLMEDIQDSGNLGSMLRSAAAAGCDAAFLSKGCADAWSPKVLRAAMGGHFALRIYERQDLRNIANEFHGTLLAASLKATRSLYECDLDGNVAFMIGNEGAGLTDELMGFATQLVTIPIPGKVESLNAAAAAAICLFEVVRRRNCL